MANKKCTGCQNELRPIDAFCTICGQKVEESQIKENEVTCIKCHGYLEEGSTFCMHCGANQLEEIDNTAPTPIQENQTVVEVRKCEVCHANVPEENIFCESCGTKYGKKIPVQSVATPQEVIKPVPLKVKPPKVKKEKKKMTKKTKLIALVILLLALIGAGVGSLFYFNSKDKQKEALIEIIEKKDMAKLADNAVSSDGDVKITKGSLAPFKALLDAEFNKNQVIEAIDSEKENLGVELVKKGKIFGIIPRYKLLLIPSVVEVKTNIKGATLGLDDKEIAKSDKDDFSIKTNKLLPGQYTFTLKDKPSKLDEKMTKIVSPSTKKIDYTVKKIAFKITSNKNGAKVMKNNKEVGMIKDGSYDTGSMIWTEGLTYKLIYKFEDKTEIETESLEIDDADDVSKSYSLDFESGVSESEVSDFLDEVYYELDKALYYPESSSTRDEATDALVELFEGGSENSQYQDFMKFIDETVTSHDKEKISYRHAGMEGIELLNQTGKDKYRVAYKMYYKTYYYSDFKEDNKLNDLKEVMRYNGVNLVRDSSADYGFKIIDMGGATGGMDIISSNKI